ncbi:hypothetical protein VW35_13330 [Devosia soli]|uniref:Uncharacterized protein n=1 Tax=Devosia soli TaxID=361041 RepID=A0A0F5L900_9HYPH|nr:hypothetical protein [Devosia soli]KKB78082.1 hypothetical protein VW35_13330 [Devosia soli]
MKLTWFGDDTFRIHAAGTIVLVDEGEGALPAVDRAELVSGAELFGGFAGWQVRDPVAWKPRTPLRMLEADEAMRRPEVVRLGPGVLVVDADGEAPLVLAQADFAAVGRWLGQAIVVLIGEGLAARGAALLERAAPRLIALAGSEMEVEAAFDALRDRLDGTGLIALERGLAVEV